MQRYFSHICDGTNVQADWRRSFTYGRAPNAIDISQGSLTCPSYTDTGPPFLYGDSDTPSQLVAFYDTLGIRRTYSRLKPRRPHGGTLFGEKNHATIDKNGKMNICSDWLETYGSMYIHVPRNEGILKLASLSPIKQISKNKSNIISSLI